jgi:hypothetical protein
MSEKELRKWLKDVADHCIKEEMKTRDTISETVIQTELIREKTS